MPVTKFTKGKGRKRRPRKTVFQGRGKKIITVFTVNARQSKKKIFTVDAHTCCLSEKRADVKPDAHLEVLYAQFGEMSREVRASSFCKLKKGMEMRRPCVSLNSVI